MRRAVTLSHRYHGRLMSFGVNKYENVISRESDSRSILLNNEKSERIAFSIHESIKRASKYLNEYQSLSLLEELNGRKYFLRGATDAHPEALYRCSGDSNIQLVYDIGELEEEYHCASIVDVQYSNDAKNRFVMLLLDVTGSERNVLFIRDIEEGVWLRHESELDVNSAIFAPSSDNIDDAPVIYFSVLDKLLRPSHVYMKQLALTTRDYKGILKRSDKKLVYKDENPNNFIKLYSSKSKEVSCIQVLSRDQMKILFLSVSPSVHDQICLDAFSINEECWNLMSTHSQSKSDVSQGEINKNILPVVVPPISRFFDTPIEMFVPFTINIPLELNDCLNYIGFSSDFFNNPLYSSYIHEFFESYPELKCDVNEDVCSSFRACPDVFRESSAVTPSVSLKNLNNDELEILCYLDDQMTPRHKFSTFMLRNHRDFVLSLPETDAALIQTSNMRLPLMSLMQNSLGNESEHQKNKLSLQMFLEHPFQGSTTLLLSASSSGCSPIFLSTSISMSVLFSKFSKLPDVWNNFSNLPSVQRMLPHAFLWASPSGGLLDADVFHSRIVLYTRGASLQPTSVTVVELDSTMDFCSPLVEDPDEAANPSPPVNYINSPLFRVRKVWEGTPHLDTISFPNEEVFDTSDSKLLDSAGEFLSRRGRSSLWMNSGLEEFKNIQSNDSQTENGRKYVPFEVLHRVYSDVLPLANPDFHANKVRVKLLSATKKSLEFHVLFPSGVDPSRAVSEGETESIKSSIETELESHRMELLKHSEEYSTVAWKDFPELLHTLSSIQEGRGTIVDIPQSFRGNAYLPRLISSYIARLVMDSRKINIPTTRSEAEIISQASQNIGIMSRILSTLPQLKSNSSTSDAKDIAEINQKVSRSHLHLFPTNLDPFKITTGHKFSEAVFLAPGTDNTPIPVHLTMRSDSPLLSEENLRNLRLRERLDYIWSSDDPHGIISPLTPSSDFRLSLRLSPLDNLIKGKENRKSASGTDSKMYVDHFSPSVNHFYSYFKEKAFLFGAQKQFEGFSVTSGGNDCPYRVDNSPFLLGPHFSEDGSYTSADINNDVGNGQLPISKDRFFALMSGRKGKEMKYEKKVKKYPFLYSNSNMGNRTLSELYSRALFCPQTPYYSLAPSGVVGPLMGLEYHYFPETFHVQKNNNDNGGTITAPCVMTAYGSYGHIGTLGMGVGSRSSSQLGALAERGWLLAFAEVRGSGGLGGGGVSGGMASAWHAAGCRHNKPHSAGDLASAAKTAYFLGLSSASRTVGFFESAGAVTGLGAIHGVGQRGCKHGLHDERQKSLLRLAENLLPLGILNVAADRGHLPSVKAFQWKSKHKTASSVFYDFGIDDLCDVLAVIDLNKVNDIEDIVEKAKREPLGGRQFNFDSILIDPSSNTSYQPSIFEPAPLGLFRAVTLHSPFIDVEGGLQPGKPLAEAETKEWGSISNPAELRNIRSFSPLSTFPKDLSETFLEGVSTYPSIWTSVAVDDPRTSVDDTICFVERVRSTFSSRIARNLKEVKVNEGDKKLLIVPSTPLSIQDEGGHFLNNHSLDEKVQELTWMAFYAENTQILHNI